MRNDELTLQSRVFGSQSEVARFSSYAASFFTCSLACHAVDILCLCVSMFSSDGRVFCSHHVSASERHKCQTRHGVGDCLMCVVRMSCIFSSGRTLNHLENVTRMICIRVCEDRI